MVDALVVRQRAADQHLAVQRRASALASTLRDHTAVVEQQLVTDTAVLDQIRVVDADDGLAAGLVSGWLVEKVKRSPTCSSMRLSAVGRYGFSGLAGRRAGPRGDQQQRRFAHQLDADAVLVGRAMGEVQAGDVQAGDNQLFEYGGAVTGWAEGGDDFGA